LTLRRVALDRPITVRAVFFDLDFEPIMISCPGIREDTVEA